MVPIKNPKMVDRKVKLISVQASPSVKKMVSVFQIALGCDQKKPSSMPVLADTSHRPMMPIRMPNCVITIAQVGQSFWTGRRRGGRAMGLVGADLVGNAMAPGACVSA